MSSKQDLEKQGFKKITKEEFDSYMEQMVGNLNEAIYGLSKERIRLDEQELEIKKTMDRVLRMYHGEKQAVETHELEYWMNPEIGLTYTKLRKRNIGFRRNRGEPYEL